MHMDHGPPKAWYQPLLKQPVLLHSSRDAGTCTMTDEQCAYKTRYWVFWYNADHVFALPTVYFFIAAILVFSLCRALITYATSRRPPSPSSSSSSSLPLWNRAVAGLRFFAYKTWRIGRLDRNSQSLGAYILLGLGFAFFAGMTLGPQPYYWPTDAKYGSSPPIATRAGWMALACMPFVLAFSAKANVVTLLTGVSHEKLNVWHGWVSWAMFVLALVHTFPFIIYQKEVVQQLQKTFVTGGVWLTGVIALVAQAWLTFMSISWIRNKFYEFFKAAHFFFAIVFVVFFFLHCGFRLSSWDYFIAGGSLYIASLLFAFVKTYFVHGVRHEAEIRYQTPLSLRISFASKASWKAGEHVFLRFIACGAHALTAHPLTVCSLPGRAKGREGGEMVFFVQPRGGLTGRLAALARARPDKTIPVLIEGPYGGMSARWHRGFRRTVLIAGGSCCGFTLALIEAWLRDGEGAPDGEERQLELVLTTRDPEMRAWYMEELQRLAERQSLTGSTRLPGVTMTFCETHDNDRAVASSKPAAASSSEEESKPATPVDEEKALAVGSVRPATDSVASLFGFSFSRGRPDSKAIVDRHTSVAGVTVGVAVCGPASLVHDVGAAAAEAQLRILRGRPGATEVYLHKEVFS
ncbi:Flavoprotein transmembrane component [Cordyceps fumosorosea ARSEF 2679]|uniref:Flavoprotein transmembrane component n=1 Tax=Cordyceps fumosorosea (strain ARSEF 2679) TaxID=1081104 RepID=A0A167XCZ0_CORFA|nr:Flavoprotein transmembrane component [Cordyceps fumosorosea ARSEF 2679]OAA64823.1 Flavoprotein transmembrane component [Cordyceps fumosorosea ARSEF 2679]